MVCIIAQRLNPWADVYKPPFGGFEIGSKQLSWNY
jgi:hypothetical protein